MHVDWYLHCLHISHTTLNPYTNVFEIPRAYVSICSPYTQKETKKKTHGDMMM